MFSSSSKGHNMQSLDDKDDDADYTDHYEFRQDFEIKNAGSQLKKKSSVINEIADQY